MSKYVLKFSSIQKGRKNVFKGHFHEVEQYLSSKDILLTSAAMWARKLGRCLRDCDGFEPRLGS